ncbi:hypothetical protein [Actinoplanes sp. NPDC026670]|uniref:hypothetical protein n=1 Tax=Actinoplanes sp. NPDC026670 TaxID=3154700 RepID=UPI0033E2BA1D
MTGVSRWLVASVLILGPLFWCVGLLLRTRAVASASFTPEEVARFATEEFAARQQLAAYAANPGLTISAYGLFLAGAILLIPATAILTYLAARRSPVLATMGGLLVILGFAARVYFAGVEQVAFQLVDIQGVDPTAALVLDAYVNVSYGPLRIPVTAAFGQYLGMPLLAAALYRAEIFGGARVLVLLWSAMMWGGVLKAAGWWDVVSSAALFVVLAALAVEIGRHGDPRLRRGGILSW